MREWRHRFVLATLIFGGVISAGLPGAALGQERITLRTIDAKTIEGLIWGKGDTALILCHGGAFKEGGASFKHEAQFFANHGFKCLAISFRGYPTEIPTRPISGEYDVRAAVEFMSRSGVKQYFLFGSSMGGHFALKAVPFLKDDPAFGGLILLSAYDNQVLGKLEKPKLFVTAKDDDIYYGPVTKCFAAAAPPKQMIAYSKGGHGQRLFVEHGQALLDQILQFIRAHQKE